MGPPDWAPGQLGSFILIIAILLALVSIVLLLIFFPKLEKVKATPSLEPVMERANTEKKVDEGLDEEVTINKRRMDITLRLLEPDEKRVVETLMKAGGNHVTEGNFPGTQFLPR